MAPTTHLDSLSTGTFAITTRACAADKQNFWNIGWLMVVSRGQGCFQIAGGVARNARPNFRRCRANSAVVDFGPGASQTDSYCAATRQLAGQLPQVDKKVRIRKQFQIGRPCFDALDWLTFLIGYQRY